MITMLTAAALAQQPWQVGPSPSASTAQKGLFVSAHGSMAGEPTGGRVGVGLGLGKRFWFAGNVATGAGWQACPECDTTAFTGTARFLALDTAVFKGAVWGTTLANQEAQQLSAGVALEMDIGRFAVDTSWPLWTSRDPWDSILNAPELGARWHWSKRNATRVAVVGLDPELALTHRLDLGMVGFEATARTTDDGPMIEGGVRLEF